MENFLCNALLSFGLIELVKEVTQIQIIENILDLLVMLIMVVISRLVSNYIEKKVKLKKK